MTPCETCPVCSEPARRTLGSRAYCRLGAEDLLEPLRDRVLTDEGGIGWGRQSGPLRPDWGPGWADLECTTCGATWTGPLGEVCGWCVRTHELLIGAHRAMLLRPQDLDNDAKRVDRARRLAWAVQHELVTEHEAHAAIARQEARRAA